MPLSLPESLALLMPDGAVRRILLEDYLRGVIAAALPADAPLEAMKSLAVAARTFAANTHRHLEREADVCTTRHCQAWSERANPRAARAVIETRGVVGTYNDKLIEAFYFEHCDGKTRDAKGVLIEAPAYLKSVACPCGFASIKGHGIGMCMRGMLAMARHGDTYQTILRHYYRGAALQQLEIDASTRGQVTRATRKPESALPNPVLPTEKAKPEVKPTPRPVKSSPSTTPTTTATPSPSATPPTLSAEPKLAAKPFGAPALKPEAKPVPTPAPKAEPKPEAKPSATPLPKLEPKPFAAPAPKTESKPAATPEPKLEPKPSAAPASKVQAKPTATPTPEAKPEAKPSATPKPEAEPAAAPKPEPSASPALKPEAKPTAKPAPKAEPKPVASPKPKPEAKPSASPKPEPKPKPESKPSTSNTFQPGVFPPTPRVVIPKPGATPSPPAATQPKAPPLPRQTTPRRTARPKIEPPPHTRATLPKPVEPPEPLVTLDNAQAVEADDMLLFLAVEDVALTVEPLKPAAYNAPPSREFDFSNTAPPPTMPEELPGAETMQVLSDREMFVPPRSIPPAQFSPPTTYVNAPPPFSMPEEMPSASDLDFIAPPMGAMPEEPTHSEFFAPPVHSMIEPDLDEFIPPIEKFYTPLDAPPSMPEALPSFQNISADETPIMWAPPPPMEENAFALNQPRLLIDSLPGPRVIAGTLPKAGTVVTIRDARGNSIVTVSGVAKQYGAGGFEAPLTDDGAYHVKFDGTELDVSLENETVFIYYS